MYADGVEHLPACRRHTSKVLQLEGLELSKKELGENNLTTAKYYGNLGRLYQTRCDYQKSEEMHR